MKKSNYTTLELCRLYTLVGLVSALTTMLVMILNGSLTPTH